MTMSSLSVLARSWECSLMTCSALVIMFSVSSVLSEDSLRVALRSGKQKEKAGADSGATSMEVKLNRLLIRRFALYLLKSVYTILTNSSILVLISIFLIVMVSSL